MKIKLGKNRNIINKILIISILLLSGCTFFNSKLKKAENKTDEMVREDTSAALIANQKTTVKIVAAQTALVNTNLDDVKISLDGAGQANEVSQVFLKRTQNLAGLPIVSQDRVVQNLLSTNPAVKIKEEKAQEIKQGQEEALIERIQQLEDKLQQMGVVAEKERNSSIISRAWHWAFSTFGILGIAALFIFCPALIPIFGRLIALVVSWFPKLTSWLGVVSHKTVLAISTGVEEFKNELEAEHKLTPQKSYTPKEVLDLINTKLAISTDKSDKKVIDAIKTQANL